MFRIKERMTAKTVAFERKKSDKTVAKQWKNLAKQWKNLKNSGTNSGRWSCHRTVAVEQIQNVVLSSKCSSVLHWDKMPCSSEICTMSWCNLFKPVMSMQLILPTKLRIWCPTYECYVFRKWNTNINKINNCITSLLNICNIQPIIFSGLKAYHIDISIASKPGCSFQKNVVFVNPERETWCSHSYMKECSIFKFYTLKIWGCIFIDNTH